MVLQATLRRVGSDSEQLNAARKMAKPGSVSRLGRDMGPEPPRVSKGPLLQGPSMEHRAALPGTAKPEQPAPTMPRLVFRDTASPDEQCVTPRLPSSMGGQLRPYEVGAGNFAVWEHTLAQQKQSHRVGVHVYCRHRRVNPFEGLRTQQYKAAIGRDDGAVQTAAPASEPPAAAPEAAKKSGPPAAVTPPAVVEERALEEPAQEPRAPVPPKEGPESLRQVNASGLKDAMSDLCKLGAQIDLLT